MKVSSLPNLNRETTSFPNFFTLFQHPADHHHHDTALQIHEHSCDTEASETSPYKAILSPSISFDETNEIGFLAGTNSVGVFRSESENNDRTRPNSVSVGSNQFGGSEWPKLPSYGGTSVTSPISQEIIEQPISPLCPTKRAFTQIHTFQFLEIKEATMTEAGTSKSSRSETPAPLPPFSKSLQTAKGKGIDSRFTSENLQQYFGYKRKDVAASLGVSVSTLKRMCRMQGITLWRNQMGSSGSDEWRPPDQHGGNNPSLTCRTMATNGLTEMQNEMVGLELNEFFLNFVEGPNGWNTEFGSIAEMSSDWDVFDALEEGSTPCQHPMPTIPDMMPHLSCSEPAPFQQPMPTVPRITGSLDDLRNLLTSPEESFLAGDAFGSINRTVPSCSYPVSSQTMSTVPHTTESSDDLRNLLALEKEPLWAGHVSESIILPVASCFDPTPSQSMPTILHTMPTNPGMMSLLRERQDTMSVNLKATYEGTTIKFQFPLTSGINELKEEVSKTLECELGSFRVEYMDEEGEWILMARDENVREYLRLVISLGNQVTKLKVYKVPNTTNLL